MMLKRFELALAFLAAADKAMKKNERVMMPTTHQEQREEFDDDYEFNEFFNIQDSRVVVHVDIPLNMTKDQYIIQLKNDLHDLMNVLNPSDHSIHAHIDRICET